MFKKKSGLVNISASTCDKKVPYKRLVLFNQFKQWFNNFNIPSNECLVMFIRLKKVRILVTNKRIGNFESVYTLEGFDCNPY